VAYLFLVRPVSDDDFVIFPPFETFYILSLLSCTESALISAEWVSRFLPEYVKRPEKFPPQSVLNHLQNIALQGAAISRFFWPVGNKYQRRGAFLRERFKLDDSSPLRSRELRNRMEHYDEYLDDYFATERMVGHILPDYVGPEPVEEECPTTCSVLISWIPEESRFSVFDSSYSHSWTRFFDYITFYGTVTRLAPDFHDE